MTNVNDSSLMGMEELLLWVSVTYVMSESLCVTPEAE